MTRRKPMATRKGTKTYNSWLGMKQRCNNPKHHKYPAYGGRGIYHDWRWSDFENFLSDMGERPEGKTLDRYPDKNGNYFKDNCRWATSIEQNNNRNRLPGLNPIEGVCWQKDNRLVTGGRWKATSKRCDNRKLLYIGPDLFEAICRRKSYEAQAT